MTEKKISIKLLKFIWETIPWVLVTLLLIICILLGLNVSKKKKRIKEEKLAAYNDFRPPLNIVVQEAEPTLVVDKITLPAVISPWNDLTVLAEATGKIISLFVKEGNVVSEGDILAKIDPKDYQNRLMQTEANYNLAQTEYNRISKLIKNNISTKALLDSAEANLKNTQASIEAAKIDLTRCTITAPISGFINEKFISKGSLVNHSDPLFQILDTKRVKVEVGIPESDVYAINNIKEAQITVEALDNLELVGKKIFLSRQPNTFARAYNLKLAVDNPKYILRPGMFAKVTLVKAKYPDSFLVPLYSVMNNNNEHFLYIINNEKAYYSAVKLGVMNGWQVQILSGLKPNDKVVVVGQRNLEDGQDVTIIRTIKNPKSTDR